MIAPDFQNAIPTVVVDKTDQNIWNTVLPPSTPVAGTDTAIVVALSPNGSPVSVSNFPGAVSPVILNISMPVANTEYVITLPQTAKRLLLRLRNSSRCQFSYIAGQSNTNYITMSAGVVYQEGELNLSAPLLLYIQCPKPAEIAEILYWT